MYEKIERLTTPGFRLLTALVLLVAGLIWQIASGKVLDMYAFYIMAAAMLSLASVILEKFCAAGNHFIPYVIFNMVVLIAGVVLTGSGGFTGVVLYSIWGICVIAEWGGNAVLLSCEDILKRVVMGFVAAVMNIIFVAIVFMIPILLQANA
ncbi:MAG: hypothetical protein HFG34_05795 [Eubacterium sp.]|nr:hypothetical protein [Eubacterium sp.]